MEVSSARPLVSFVIPTLNRGRYVTRAVESCLSLDARAADVDVEVIVLDSESDDGSWEELQEKFSGDSRVTLAKNRRGLGPTHSWLDGARLVRGDFVTFVWSDDYLSPNFLAALMPALQQGARLTVGHGCERDIDCDEPLPCMEGMRSVPRDTLLMGYLRRGTRDGIYRPLSPTCSLFSRQTFDCWLGLVENWCLETPLRKEVLWQRAIGPDLMLYLVALKLSGEMVSCARENTAQFSVHSGSITKYSSRWPYETGYWLARLWVVEDDRIGAGLHGKLFAAGAAAVFVFGFILAAAAPLRMDSGLSARASSAILLELAELVRVVRQRGALLLFVIFVAEELVLCPLRLLQYAFSRR